MQQNKLISATAALLIVSGIVVYFFLNPQTPAVSTIDSGTSSTSAPTLQPVPSTTYKDGIYTAQGTYQSPGGTQHIAISLTIASDIVTDALVTEGAIDSTSRRFQGLFISGFKQQVVGKPLASLSLSQVSGSSLTPTGFNDAVAKIKAQAQQ